MNGKKKLAATFGWLPFKKMARFLSTAAEKKVGGKLASSQHIPKAYAGSPIPTEIAGEIGDRKLAKSGDVAL